MSQNAATGPTGRVTVQYTLPFVWPAFGPITSFMGPEHPDGIDIGLDAGGPLEIRAAARGTVTAAGGSDEEPLGLSIVLDHGNGITTIYGHLSEILVAEGDEVAPGALIGVGGSTGTSSGDHLHFEVRKDGATVDPFDVLPDRLIGTSLSVVDCEVTPVFLPAGSQSRFDFDGLLDSDDEILTARAISMDGSTALKTSLEGRTTVHLESPIDFDVPDGEDEYRLAVTLSGASGNRVLSCIVVVERHTVPTTFYIRAQPSVEAEAAAEEIVEPTPTPNPWPQGPTYTMPVSDGSDAVAPAYHAPSSSGVVVESPSYNLPSLSPTRTVTE